MAENPEFKAARKKLEDVQSELQTLQTRKDEIRQTRMVTSGRIWQIRRTEAMAAERARLSETNQVPQNAGAKP